MNTTANGGGPLLSESEIVAFLNSLAALQLTGTGAQMAQHISMPVAYYLPERVLVFTRAEGIAPRFDAHRSYLNVCRVTKIEARHLTVLDATPDRALVQLEWHYLSDEGRLLRRSHVQYVLSRAETPLGLRIDLVDYATLAFPHFLEEPSALRCV